MPGKEDYCDEHVPRGCSCNAKLKEGIDPDSEEAKHRSSYTEKLDDKGRRYPCCEYSAISEDLHNSKELVNFGWEAYYEQHPEKRKESEEVEKWEKKLGVD